MNIKLTVRYKALEDGWFFGQAVEIPGILSEAGSLEELKDNLSEAIAMYPEYRRREKLEDEGAQSQFDELELNE